MEIKIDSIINLITLLGEKPKLGHTRFFRGHSDKDYKLEPSIYREKGFIRNESNIIRDAIASSPDDFNSSMTLFETLVKLQHYGYPTRLLDLTTNMLVALYFCVRNTDADGELHILDIPDAYVKYYDSDTVSVLSAISFRDYDFNIMDSDEDYVHNRILGDVLEYLRTTEELEKYGSIIIEQNEKRKEAGKVQLDIERYKRSLVSNFNQSRKIEEFNSRNEILKLIHDIRSDKPRFLPKIISGDLGKIICVKPKLNNARIIRQQGCFLLFGIKDSKDNAPKVDDSWAYPQRILISKEHKDRIKSELQQFGISEKVLFPELESQAKEILAKYK